MKRFVIALSMMLAFGVTAMADKPQREHIKAGVSVQVKDDTVGIVAYSDTTSYGEGDADDSIDAEYDGEDVFSINASDIRNPFSLVAYLSDSAKSGGGVFMVIFAIILALFVWLSPFLLIAFIVYYALRSKRQKYKIMEKALEEGRPLPKGLMASSVVDNDQMLRRGLKHAFLGIGLAVLFYCLHASELAGIGWLTFFYGMGQVAIAYFTKRKKSDECNEDADDPSVKEWQDPCPKENE